jgi:hypothetical protein
MKEMRAMEKQVELRPEEARGKEPYDPPLLIRHGALRDLTGQVSPIIVGSASS